jgi:hypothetical protein
VPVFVWITKEDSKVEIVNAEYRSTRTGTKLVHPLFRMQKIPLKSVNLDISERYRRALGKLQENLKSWVESECLGDSQAPLDASEGWKGRGKSGDRATGGPSATAGPGVQEAKERGGEEGRREGDMKKKVTELRELLKKRSKPLISGLAEKSQLVDRLLEDEEA